MDGLLNVLHAEAGWSERLRVADLDRRAALAVAGRPCRPAAWARRIWMAARGLLGGGRRVAPRAAR
jgi:hypothetical protein